MQNVLQKNCTSDTKHLKSEEPRKFDLMKEYIKLQS